MRNIIKAVQLAPKAARGIKKIIPIAVAVGTATSVAAASNVIEHVVNINGGEPSAPTIEVVDNPGENTFHRSASIVKGPSIIFPVVEKAFSYALDAPVNTVLGSLKGFTNGMLLRSDITVASPDNSILFCIVKHTATGAINIQSSPAFATVVKIIIMKGIVTIVVLVITWTFTKKAINYFSHIYQDKVEDRVEMETKPPTDQRDKTPNEYIGDSL